MQPTTPDSPLLPHQFEIYASPRHSLAGFGAFSCSDMDISPYSVSSSSSTQISESGKSSVTPQGSR